MTAVFYLPRTPMLKSVHTSHTELWDPKMCSLLNFVAIMCISWYISTSGLVNLWFPVTSISIARNRSHSLIHGYKCLWLKNMQLTGYSCTYSAMMETRIYQMFGENWIVNPNSTICFSVQTNSARQSHWQWACDIFSLINFHWAKRLLCQYSSI